MLSDLMDHSPPGSSIHGILHARVLEWGAIAFSRETAGFPRGSNGKESARNAGDLGSSPGSGRSRGGGHSNSLQYSCLENPTDRGAWQATVHGIARNLTHTQHVLFVLSCVSPVIKRRQHVEKLSCCLLAVIHVCCPAPQHEMMV